MNKDDEQILVVPSDVIFGEGKWQGLKTGNLDYYLDLIKNHGQFKRRGDVEEDPSFQQIIPYILFSYEDNFFVYKYLEKAGEQRLVDTWQLGVGGHLNERDIMQGAIREWEEEVDFFGNFLEKKFVGIMNDESRPVEQVHLGLVYHFIGDSPRIKVRETDKMEGRLMTLEELEDSVSHSVWMRIVYDQYLNKPSQNQQKLFEKNHMIKNTHQGKFIVIEGLDGSGKSAQVDLLVSFLRSQGKEVMVTKEPTMESEAGRKVKQALKGEIVIEPLELQKLYVQDRKEHLENKIIPALRQGKFVVSSRYAFSTFAYGYSDGLDVDLLVKMNDNFLLPDLTLVIDVSPESCVKRIEGRGAEKEIFEKIEKLQKVNEIYKKMPEMFENVVVVNGEAAVDQVFESAKVVLLQFLEKENAMENQFSQEERYLIAPFFTNLDKPVFGVTFLPPEVIGALCSRASRAKDDLRKIFLEEFVKPFLAGDSQYSEAMRGLIDFLHKYPAELIFSNPKARDFYITWLAQFGDDSIAQEAGTHLIYSGISQIAIKQIEDQRVGIAPLEKSTRYVDFSTKEDGKYRYFTPPELNLLGLEGEYNAAMDNLFETYTALLAEYMEFLRKKYPGEEEKVLRTKAFDTVRTILPMSTLSQLALFANGQAFEYMVNRCLDHNLSEVRQTAKDATEELGKVIPAFLRRVESEESAGYRKYLSQRGERISQALRQVGFEIKPAPKTEGPNVRLLEYDPNGENKIIASLIFSSPAINEPYEDILGRVAAMSAEEKETVLQAALYGRKAKYYKTPRSFEEPYFKFEIVMNIGAWRDLHRHRMHTQIKQMFTARNGFDVPEGLKEAGLDAKFISAILKAEEVFYKIEAKDGELAQYCACLAHRVRFIQKQCVRQFFWETELRTIPQGHPDYRKIEQEKVRLVERVYPMLSKYLLVDMHDYDFARRGEAAQIQRKENELKQFFSQREIAN